MHNATRTSPNKTQSQKKSSHDPKIDYLIEWVNCPLPFGVNGLGTKKKILKEPNTPHVPSVEIDRSAETTPISNDSPIHGDLSLRPAGHTINRECPQKAKADQEAAEHLDSDLHGED